MQHFPDLFIYADFQEEINWIKKLHQREKNSFPSLISELAKYYLEKRLYITQRETVTIDRRLGRPFPYFAFWFAKAFDLKDPQIIRNLALSLVRISIYVSARDDLVDANLFLNGQKVSEHALICLANFYYGKYFQIFEELLPPSSVFWYYLSRCLNEWSQYESWLYLFRPTKHIQPFSYRFLKNTSSYLFSAAFPTIAAIAFLTHNESKLPCIEKFLRAYWIGWKIFDDIKDWRNDLDVPNLNHSSVLCGAMKYFESTPNAEAIEAAFLSNDYVDEVYNNLLNYYKKARYYAHSLSSNYLTTFMNSQLEFHAEQFKRQKETLSNFKKGILSLIG